MSNFNTILNPYYPDGSPDPCYHIQAKSPKTPMTKYEAIVEAIKELDRHIEETKPVACFAVNDRTRLVMALVEAEDDKEELEKEKEQ